MHNSSECTVRTYGMAVCCRRTYDISRWTFYGSAGSARRSTTGGVVNARLPKVGFIPDSMPDAFGFLDPALVIRGSHPIPSFADGRTTELLRGGPFACRFAGEEDDWTNYYVGIPRHVYATFRGRIGRLENSYRSGVPVTSPVEHDDEHEMEDDAEDDTVEVSELPDEAAINDLLERTDIDGENGGGDQEEEVEEDVDSESELIDDVDEPDVSGAVDAES
ncbi:hypothetical protein EV122DRAFT_284580 [Schizophyllum commune]